MNEMMFTSGPKIQETRPNLQTPILEFAIDTASSGNNTIVAADPTRKIKVLSYVFVCGGAVSVRWKSGSTNKSGAMLCTTYSGVASPVTSPYNGPLFSTGVNEALVLNLSDAVQVSGHGTYYLE